MADLIFAGEDQAPQIQALKPDTPRLITQGTETDISDLLQGYGNKQAFTPGQPSGSSISDEDIQRQLQIAIDAVGKAASKSIPAYNSPDTAKYLDALQRVRAVANDNVADLDQQRKDFGTASAQEKQAIHSIATAQVQKENADQARAQHIADINYAVNHEFGVEGNADRLADKVGVFHQLNDKYLAIEETNQKLKASVAQDAAKLREEASVSFGDDPIRWIEGIFTIPQLNDTVEAGTKQIQVLDNKQATLKSAIDSIQTDINETVAAAKDAKEARASTVPSITAAQASAVNNLAVAQATEKAAQTDKALATQNSTFAGQKFAQVVTEENAEHSAIVLKQQNNELIWRSGVQQVMKADSDATAKLRIVDLMTKMQDNQQIIGMLKMFETRMGYPPGTFTLSRYKALPDTAKEFVFGQALGFSGATPGDAFFNMRDAAQKGIQPGPGISPQTEKMMRDMKSYVEQLAGGKAAQTDTAGMNKEQQKAYYVQKVNERYLQLQANPTTDANVNPFYEQSPQQVALHSPGIAQSKIGKILQSYISGSSMPNTDMVVSALTKGAENTDEAAKMISQYYQLNMKVRNSSIDFQSFGAKPTNSYFYNYRVPGPIFTGTTGRVDLTNETEVKNMLLRQQKSKAITEGLAGGIQGTP